jgi:hypothetical protein
MGNRPRDTISAATMADLDYCLVQRIQSRQIAGLMPALSIAMVT